jgi:hypothetical protein
MKSKDQVIKELSRKIDADTLQSQTDEYLRGEGIESKDFEEIFQKAQEQFLKRRKLLRRIVWSTLAAFTFILFYAWVPVRTYNAAPLLVAALGGVLFTLFIFQALGDFTSIYELVEYNNSQEPETDEKRKLSFYAFIPGIIVILVFYMHFGSREEDALKADGVKVAARIIDGYSKKSRRTSTYEVTVFFQTVEGKSMTVKEEVTEDEFQRFHEGKIVEIIYSKKNPAMIELLTDDKAVKSYIGSQERDIKIQDLIMLLSVPELTLGDTLNTICYGWLYSKQEKVWMNERRNIAIYRVDSNTVRCLTLGQEYYSRFPKELEGMGYSKLENPDSTSKAKLFTTEEFIVSLRAETSIDNNVNINVKLITEIVKR